MRDITLKLLAIQHQREPLNDQALLPILRELLQYISGINLWIKRFVGDITVRFSDSDQSLQTLASLIVQVYLVAHLSYESLKEIELETPEFNEGLAEVGLAVRVQRYLTRELISDKNGITADKGVGIDLEAKLVSQYIGFLNSAHKETIEAALNVQAGDNGQKCFDYFIKQIKETSISLQRLWPKRPLYNSTKDLVKRYKRALDSQRPPLNDAIIREGIEQGSFFARLAPAPQSE